MVSRWGAAALSFGVLPVSCLACSPLVAQSRRCRRFGPILAALQLASPLISVLCGLGTVFRGRTRAFLFALLLISAVLCLSHSGNF